MKINHLSPWQLLGKYPLLAIIISSITAFCFAYPPFCLPFGASLGIFFLCVLTEKCHNTKQSFKYGFIVGICASIVTLYWLLYTVSMYGTFSWWVSTLIVFPLYLYLALYYGIITHFAKWYMQKFSKSPPSILLATFWVFLEYVKGSFASGFPWLLVGHSLPANSMLAQISDLGGPMLVSFILVWLGAEACKARHFLLKPLQCPTSSKVLVVCLILCSIYGVCQKNAINKALEKNNDISNIILVQGNIDQKTKFEEKSKLLVIDRYASLTKDNFQKFSIKPDLIVWPETALPFLFSIDQGTRDYFFDSIFPLPCPIVVGAPDVEPNVIKKKWVLKNRVFGFNNNGQILGLYDKVHLVPFGEYAPFEFLGRLVTGIGNFSKGKNLSLIKMGNYKLGILICYEAIFPSIARKEVGLGANLLLNVSNDAWFGNTSAPYQHLRISSFLATTFRIPLVRVVNSGISAVISPTGKLELKSSLFKSWVSMHPVKIIDKPYTVYAKYGDAWVLMTSVCCMIYLLWMLRRKKFM